LLSYRSVEQREGRCHAPALVLASDPEGSGSVRDCAKRKRLPGFRHHDLVRRLGTKIAIDDFGTGYSSLKYLTQYPVNRLKLAQEFVLQVTVDYRNAAVVRAAIRLANELGQEVIAEGVETDAQVRFLLGAGCEQAQGYYFSQPVTAQKATELLRAGRIQPETGARIASSAA